MALYSPAFVANADDGFLTSIADYSLMDHGSTSYVRCKGSQYIRCRCCGRLANACDNSTIELVQNSSNNRLGVLEKRAEVNGKKARGETKNNL